MVTPKNLLKRQLNKLKGAVKTKEVKESIKKYEEAIKKI